MYRSAHKGLKGLNAEDSIKVTFHCIVPQHLWEWDETSCIHMRFEGDALGNWKHNLGNFKKGRLVIGFCDYSQCKVYLYKWKESTYGYWVGRKSEQGNVQYCVYVEILKAHNFMVFMDSHQSVNIKRMNFVYYYML